MVRIINLHQDSQIGRRSNNEDVEKYMLNLNFNGQPIKDTLAPIDFFLICDGHGGVKVAKIVSEILFSEFTKKTLQYPLTTEYINNIFNNINDILIAKYHTISSECGCTALIVIRYCDNNREKLQIINLGDCRAVLSRDGVASPLTKDHKPSWPDEQKRINMINIKNGTNNKIRYIDGDWRVHDLSVSRAFGDLNAKPEVSHIPEIFNCMMNKKDEFIVIACDGLWDVMQNHEVINFIKAHIEEKNPNSFKIKNRYPTEEILRYKSIAKKLSQYAIAKGSTDNISIIIAMLSDKK
jgi:serine/threonine protein phosphatase PrpC